MIYRKAPALCGGFLREGWKRKYFCCVGFLPRHFVPPPQALLEAVREGDSAVRKRLQRTA